MGSFNFRWEHPAEDVHVTGTFDNWTKSVELKKVDTGFEKLVSLPPTTEKILYKFVVDGVWIHDHTGKTETDHEGNINNVLYPEDIGPPMSAANMTGTSAAPTTTQRAGQVPLEKEKDMKDTPGAFPETPATDLHGKGEQSNPFEGAGESINKTAAAAGAGVASAAAAGAAYLGLSSAKKDGEDQQQFGVNPIPASEGRGNPISLAPGDKVPESSTITPNTISSQVHDDPELVAAAEKEEQSTVGVAPLPATGGIGNPIHLAPGEKVPESSSITTNTLDSNVKLDKASYEKSDSGAPVLPPVLTPQNERDAGGAGMFGLGPQTTNMIPESSMGMGADAPPAIDGPAGAAISSVGANSTTNQLAGQQPLEQRGVPSVVTDSQQAAHVDPEASANPRAVEEKNEIENELKSKVPEEPPVGEKKESSSNSGGIAAAVTGGVAAVGAGAAGAALALNQKTKETTGKDPVSTLPQSVQDSINGANKNSSSSVGGATTADNVGSSSTATPANAVPEEVKESQKEAHVAPEASANAEAVQEKSEVEKELLAKVPTTQETGEHAPAIAAAAGGAAVGAAGAGAYAATHSSTTAASAVPEEVKESQQAAHASPEASANAEAVQEKSSVEKELLEKVHTSNASGEPAPTASAAAATTAPSATSASGAPQLADPVGAGLAPINMNETNKGLNAPATAPATTQPQDSRDVSPMSKTATTSRTGNASQGEPLVTDGVTSAAAPATSGTPVGTPRKVAPAQAKRMSMRDSSKNSGMPDSGKEKKKGFFSKLKEKLNK
ncbi:unnamed protein product [Zymoseptoria tritici ST99CH_3D1]|uniref:AMP-activated protein kinase glycogen-binding domain-containing protein n=1 Tax=Zymoseptoria tritici ST99CH_1E4 TaxID=1276532 RepID=A0A2H1FKC3_ZYMTR|nr:unnamed protein product [Zymoseptoria tritici ST99CH_1E4]SMR43970.1 unnamed protein product [Zymoseptoria tritici ST99CH_3D1]